jgi:hypothetical protein
MSTAIGIGYLTPKVKRFTAARNERGPTDPEAHQSLLRGLLLVAGIDLALMLLIVIDMTVKPFS